VNVGVVADDLISAARRTVPSLTDAQWTAWLQQVERLGGSIKVPFDGGPCIASYPRQDAATPRREAR
jgi:hypothetical protein